MTPDDLKRGEYHTVNGLKILKLQWSISSDYMIADTCSGGFFHIARREYRGEKVQYVIRGQKSNILPKTLHKTEAMAKKACEISYIAQVLMPLGYCPPRFIGEEGWGFDTTKIRPRKSKTMDEVYEERLNK